MYLGSSSPHSPALSSIPLSLSISKSFALFSLLSFPLALPGFPFAYLLHICSLFTLSVPCTREALRYLHVCVWFISLRRALPGCFRLAGSVSGVPFLTAEQCSIAEKTHIFFIRSLADGHWGCFQDLVLTSFAPTHVGVHVSLWKDAFNSFGKRPRREHLGAAGPPILGF